MRALLVVVVGAASGWWMAGCAREPLTGPPELRIGRDSCAECGMLIAEERSAAALLVERDGRRDHLHFDDIGCLLDFSSDPERTGTVMEVYVHDYGSRAWIDAEAASYVCAEPGAIRTPMGSGIAALGSREEADALAGATGGVVLGYGGVVQRRASERVDSMKRFSDG